MGIPVEYCEPWTTPEKLCCPDAEPLVPCDDPEAPPVPLAYKWTDEELIEAATGILYRATCRLFPGMCEIKVRPCGDCGICHRGPCGCGGYAFILLQERYPIDTVDEVLIDGIVLDPASYRVDDYSRLVRIDGEGWPCCNDLSLPSTEIGTFEVTYTAGRTPPIALQMAAAELACEMKRACGGLHCNLPRNVTSVSRQGVTMNIDQLEAAVQGGGTGLAMVDAAVRQYNCARAKSRVWHPSIARRGGVIVP